PTAGLSRDDAAARRALYGANRVSPPLSCPSWVCCLLPCLLRTSSMQSFHAALPREAVVRRKLNVPASNRSNTAAPGAKRALRMDAASLVFGDVVELRAGDLVGADMRVLECSPDCVVDQSTLTAEEDNEDDDEDIEASERSLVRKWVAATSDDADPLRARNVLLMASRVVRGSAVGVVICTGDRTFWGQLLASHQWPVRSDKGRRVETHRLMGGRKTSQASPRGELLV
ncbi:hypothetical protein PybrP1_012433, partial [[Pythium] brassicae (nom. inval.)]